MTVEITPLDPATATEEDLASYYDLRLAATHTDRPGSRPPSYDAVIRRLRTPLTIYGPVQYWAGRIDGKLVGLALLGLPEEENTGIGFAEIQVHPEHRRRGVGSELLRAIVREVQGAGRTVVFAGGVPDPGPGWPWAAKRGFKEVERIVMQSLTVATANRDNWRTEMASDYRPVRWLERTPDEIVESYAQARHAIQDAPENTGSLQQPDWTVERVRSAEADYRSRNVEHRVVAAVHRSTGQVAGLTEIEIRPGANVVMQMDTAVLGEHRGHQLGLAMKAEMLRWILDERPDTTRFDTTTNSRNDHMIKVNEALGYELQNSMVNVEAETSTLAHTLNT